MACPTRLESLAVPLWEPRIIVTCILSLHVCYEQRSVKNVKTFLQREFVWSIRFEMNLYAQFIIYSGPVGPISHIQWPYCNMACILKMIKYSAANVGEECAWCNEMMRVLLWEMNNVPHLFVKPGILEFVGPRPTSSPKCSDSPKPALVSIHSSKAANMQNISTLDSSPFRTAAIYSFYKGCPVMLLVADSSFSKDGRRDAVNKFEMGHKETECFWIDVVICLCHGCRVWFHGCKTARACR